MSCDPSPAPSYAAEHCVTCGDDGVAMTVVEVDERSGLALCADCQGGRRTVETALVGALSGGDCVLVHADVAIASLPAGKSAVRERAGGMSELAV